MRLTQVSKRFGSNLALDRVDLQVVPGEISVLLGRNGAGKSTLIRILATAVLPDEGSVWVDGVDAVSEPQLARRRLGVVLGEERSHFWRLSGRENLEFFASLHGLRRRETREAVAEALAVVGLSDVAERRVDRYSTGMRGRLGIARALLGNPAVLLLDEPTRSLDPAVAHEVRRMIRELVDQRSVAVLLATHDLQEAAVMADHVVVLNRGRVVAHRSGGASASELEAVVLAGQP